VAMTDLHDLVRPYTRTGDKRVAAMIAALQKIEAENIPGDVVECGVWRGGNIILARKIAPSRVCWLYDTFTGMTKPGPEDKRRDGAPALERYKQGEWCASSVDEVRGCLAETGTLDDDKLRFVAGDVCKTLKVPENLPERIALLRLDTDWYASTKLELQTLYPRLSPGGVLIIDDYGHWQGARKATDEVLGKVALTHIDYSCVQLVKPC
jgi:O-methyltransferase